MRRPAFPLSKSILLLSSSFMALSLCMHGSYAQTQTVILPGDGTVTSLADNVGPRGEDGTSSDLQTLTPAGDGEDGGAGYIVETHPATDRSDNIISLSAGAAISGGIGGQGGASFYDYDQDGNPIFIPGFDYTGGDSGTGGNGIQGNNFTFDNLGAIAGGAGEVGGYGVFSGASGQGGHGVSGNNLDIKNGGQIEGGAGGAGAYAIWDIHGISSAGGNGGAAIAGNDLIITNWTDGSLLGGRGGEGDSGSYSTSFPSAGGEGGQAVKGERLSIDNYGEIYGGEGGEGGTGRTGGIRNDEEVFFALDGVSGSQGGSAILANDTVIGNFAGAIINGGVGGRGGWGGHAGSGWSGDNPFLNANGGNGGDGGTGGHAISGEHLTIENAGTLSGGDGGLAGMGGSAYDQSRIGISGMAGFGGTAINGNSLQISNSGIITGGTGGEGSQGGYGPLDPAEAGKGGTGGEAISGNDLAIINSGTILGGTGGLGGSGYLSSPTRGDGGDGGVAISGSNIHLTNSALIAAGAGDPGASGGVSGLAGEAAIKILDGENVFFLQEKSVIQGNIVVNGLNSNSLAIHNFSPTLVDGDLILGNGSNVKFFGNDLLVTGTTLVGQDAVLNLGGTNQNLTLVENNGTVPVNDWGASPLSHDVIVTGDMLNRGSLILQNCSSCAGQTYVQNGNWVGADGTVVLGAVLGDDSSVTDRLVIADSASGSTFVKVANAGGVGAMTHEGIQIIEVGDPASLGTFSLLGDYVFEGDQAVVGGAYAYRLYQGATSAPDDGNWYLRSTLVPTDPETPLYQPGVPVYESYAQSLLGLNDLNTLQQRVGNRFWSGNGNRVVAQGADAIGYYASAEEAGSYSDGNGIWGRIEGAHNKLDPKSSTSGADHSQNVFRMQAGADMLLNENTDGMLIGGVFAHYTHGKTKVRSIYGNGTISTDGYGFGGTLTWYGNEGFYVDGQAQATWYNSDLASTLASTGLVSGNKGFGYALSLETGKRFAITPEWSVTPQAQLSYSNVRFDSFNDVWGAHVSIYKGSKLEGRLGVTLDHEASWQNAAGLTDRAHVYGIANLYYGFSNGTRVNVANEQFSQEQERLWGGLGIGGSYNWNDDKYSLYGEGLIKTSFNDFGNSYTLKGNVGIRMKW